MKHVKRGIIIYSSQLPLSFQRGIHYKKSLPDGQLWLLADDQEAKLLLRGDAFQEIIFMPEVKDQRKEILQHATGPAKMRLLSEQHFLAQEALAQEKAAERAKSSGEPPAPVPQTGASENAPTTKTPAVRKRQRQQKKRRKLLLGGLLVLLLFIIIAAFWWLF